MTKVVISKSLPSVTIAIRCCQFDDTLLFDEMPSRAEKLWNKYILQVYTWYHYVTAHVKVFCFELFLFQDKSSIVLTSEAITDIQKGLTLGGCLLLPEEVRFSESRMSILLFPHGQMRPLQHIRLVNLYKSLLYPSCIRGGSVFKRLCHSCNWYWP